MAAANTKRRPHNFQDLTGQTFNRWTALRLVSSGDCTLWECRCSCGTVRTVAAGNLRRGLTKSCGCHKEEFKRLHRATHSASYTSEYTTWYAMKQRCTNPRNKSFHNYGGRGIRICEQWIHSFETFLSDMGLKPTPQHTIDRIDNNGNYEPGNCRWATMAEQRVNQRH